MEEIGFAHVYYGAGPLAIVIGAALRPFASWLARFLGSTVFMGIFALIAEIIPRLLGLGQGLISWGFGTVASVAFGAFKAAFSMAGIELPSFMELLSDLPAGVLWVGSALRLDRVVFILVSVPIFKLIRKAAEALASATAKAASSSLLTGGK